MDNETLILICATSTRRILAVLIAIGVSALAVGCGSSGSSSSTTSQPASTSTAAAATTTSASGGSVPTVLAAASLTKVFPMIDPNAK